MWLQQFDTTRMELGFVKKTLREIEVLSNFYQFV